MNDPLAGKLFSDDSENPPLDLVEELKFELRAARELENTWFAQRNEVLLHLRAVGKRQQDLRNALSDRKQAAADLRPEASDIPSGVAEDWLAGWNAACAMAARLCNEEAARWQVSLDPKEPNAETEREILALYSKILESLIRARLQGLERRSVYDRITSRDWKPIL